MQKQKEDFSKPGKSSQLNKSPNFHHAKTEGRFFQPRQIQPVKQIS